MSAEFDSLVVTYHLTESKEWWMGHAKVKLLQRGRGKGREEVGTREV